MRPDASNLRKRKLFAAAAEGLPTPKHACCEATVNSVCDSLFLKAVNAEDVELLDNLAESTQGSNSFPGYYSQSSTEVKFDEHLHKRDLSDEASTSWAHSRSVTSGNDSLSLESRTMSVKDDDDDDDDMEEYQISYQDDTAWHDIDGLEDCIGTNYREESKLKTAAELEGFLSSSGVNTTLSMLSSERWTLDQEAEMGRRKPTIDQEFEQYFSTLML
ncbi:Protein FAR-RED ELONGATED HYPOCOTYL 1 [Bienertia sinuspersici]